MHCVLLGDLPVKNTLHMSVSSQSLLDMSPPAVFSFNFYRFEPVNVFTIEEHEPHCADSLVDLERVTREDGSLDNNPVWVIVEQSPSSKQGQFTVTLFLVDEYGSWRESDGSEGCHHDGSVPEVSLVLVLVPVGVLAEYGTGGKPPPADFEDEPGLGLDRERPGERVSSDSNVDHGHPVLVRQQAGHHQPGLEVGLEVAAHPADDQSDEPAWLCSTVRGRQDSLLSSVKVLKLPDPRIVQGKIFLRIPVGGSETFQSAVLLEPHPGGHVHRSVHLVREQGLHPGRLQSFQFINLSGEVDVFGVVISEVFSHSHGLCVYLPVIILLVRFLLFLLSLHIFIVLHILIVTFLARVLALLAPIFFIRNPMSLILAEALGDFLHLSSFILRGHYFLLCRPGLFSLHSVRNFLDIQLLSLFSRDIQVSRLKHFL